MMVLVDTHFYTHFMAKTLGSGKHITFHQSIFDGEASIYKTKERGNNYQFRMFIKDENKHYRKSLRTDDYDIAEEKAKKLTKDLMAHGMSEKRVFSITIRQLIEKYVAYRENDIDLLTGISLMRWQIIKSQLKYLPILLGENTTLSTIDRGDLFEYSAMRNKVKRAAPETIRMEKSTINAMIKFAYRNKLIHFESFDFKQIIIKGDMLGRRGTFTEKEYGKLIIFMRNSFLKHAKERIGNRDFKMTAVIETKEQNQLEREMIRDYVFVLANSAMRVGEALKLTWGDVGNYESHMKESENEDKKKEQILVEINVRAETSKVRKHRKFLCRGGQYFLRLKKRQKHTNDEDLVFSMDGKKSIHYMRKRKYWEELMEGIGIANWEDRKLSWYSLRHYCITQRVQSGVDVIGISQMAGTFVKHITDTYLHYRKEQSRTEALKSYKKQEGQIKFL